MGGWYGVKLDFSKGGVVADKILVTSLDSRALGFDFACLGQCIVYGLGLDFGLGLVNSEFIGFQL